MAITRVSQFLASDGTSFTSAKAANTHESRIELVNLVGAETLAALEAKYDLKTKRAPRKTAEEKAAAKAAADAAKAAKATAAVSDAKSDAKSLKVAKAA